jgi:hypothetical protein
MGKISRLSQPSASSEPGSAYSGQGLNGLDDIGQQRVAAIDRFEQARAAEWVWLTRGP